MSDIIDIQTSFGEALRKRKRTERTYVGEKGRDDEITSILKYCGVDSKAKLNKALKEARNVTDTTGDGTVDEAICGKNVSLQLNREFPGWNWIVRIEEGVVSVFAKEISLVYGFHWSLMHGHPHEKWIRQQAGEYLERFRAPTHLKDVNEFKSNARYEYGRGGLHMAFDK